MAASVMAGSGKDLVPFSEGLIGGDQHGAPLVACADELEQHRHGLEVEVVEGLTRSGMQWNAT